MERVSYEWTLVSGKRMISGSLRLMLGLKEQEQEQEQEEEE